jgi:ATP/ADP translocase
MAPIKRLLENFLAATGENKGLFLPLFGCFFLVLFSYSFIRPVCESLFLSSWGASRMPHVWIISALATAVVVWVYNKFVVSTRPSWLFAVSNFLAVAFSSCSISIFQHKTGDFP